MIIFDKYINMYEHVTSVCVAVYYDLKKNIHGLKTRTVTAVHVFYKLLANLECYSSVTNSVTVTNT